MSFIVGLNLEQYALVGADTRVSYYPGNRLIYRDDETKIRTTSVGLITGAGLCDLLDPVKDRMAVEEPPHTDAMRQIIREECRKAQLRFADCPDQRVQESLETTGWMMTYITNSEQYFPAGLRLAIMGSADEDNRFRLALPGKPAFLPFSGITQEQYDELLKIVEDELRPWKQADESLIDNLVHQVGIIGRVIKRASEMSEMVSPTFQIGIQTITFDVGISNIFNLDTGRFRRQLDSQNRNRSCTMNECFFCGPTERPLTEEHVWPKWVSKLLRGKYGSDHFVHIRSTGSSTVGCWKSPHLQVTTDRLCDTCNNVWLSNFENRIIKPLVSPLIVGKSTLIKPADQWQIAAWAYKMAMLLEIAMPPEERHQEFYTPSERKQFRHETIPDEHVRVFLANFKYNQEPAHAHQHLHTLRRRDDGFSCYLKICTITAGCLGMQVIAARSMTTGSLVYASSEVEMELLGRTKQAVMPIWPPTNEGLRWPPPEAMTQQDIEDWTDMWSKAEGMYPPDSGQRENRP